MSDNNNDSVRSMELALVERMAMLEAANNFHQNSLDEISSSLKEVVKTQHVLANQKEEIVKIVNSLKDLHEDVSILKHDRDLRLYKESIQTKMNEDLAYSMDRLRKSYTADMEHANKKIAWNTTFNKFVAFIGTSILVPVILAILYQYV